MKEFSCGCKRSARSKAASVNSTGETSPALILGAISVIVSLSRSSLAIGVASFVDLQKATGHDIG